MIRPTAEAAVHLCIEPVDMRKQAATLALLIEQALGRVVFEGGVYAFTNRKRDRVKLLTWERNGLVLCNRKPIRDSERSSHKQSGCTGAIDFGLTFRTSPG